MSMMIPTGASGRAIDTADVTLIAPRPSGASTFSTLWLAGGQSIPVDATPASLAAEINAASGADVLLGPLVVSNFATPVYVGGAHVQRIDPTANGLGSVWRFASIGTTLIAAAVTVAAAVLLVNATGGGGGATPLVWTPAPVSAQATALVVINGSAFRIGNQVTLSYALQGTSTPTGTVTVTTPLPIASTVVTPGPAQGDAGAGLGAAVAASASAGNLLLVFSGAAATPFAFWTTITYPVAP